MHFLRMLSTSSFIGQSGLNRSISFSAPKKPCVGTARANQQCLPTSVFDFDKGTAELFTAHFLHVDALSYAFFAEEKAWLSARP